MYRPPEGYQIADINKAWVVLEQSESDHDAALVEEIKRLTRLEQVPHPSRRRHAAAPFLCIVSDTDCGCVGHGAALAKV